MKKTHVYLILLLSILLMAFPAYSTAQLGGEEIPEGVSGDDVYRVSSELYCDVCAGVPISSCPSVTCKAWREEIATLLGDGYSDDEIKEYFSVRYGGEVTGVPLESADRNLALGLPLVITLIIGVVIVFQVWRLSNQTQSRAYQAAQSAGLMADYDRPVPNNVDPIYLKRFMEMIETNE